MILLQALSALLTLLGLQATGCRFGPDHEIGKIEQNLVLFRMKKKRLPETPGELYEGEDWPIDPWGNLYRLEAGLDGQLVVVSLGADGAPGGSGNGEDIRGSGE